MVSLNTPNYIIPLNASLAQWETTGKHGATKMIFKKAKQPEQDVTLNNCTTMELKQDRCFCWATC